MSSLPRRSPGRLALVVGVALLTAGLLVTLPSTSAEPPAPAPAPETPPATLPADWTSALSWRCIGPANMGGRVTAISVYEADPSTYWIATASGGLLKTTNAGVTFAHQFDREATVSVGDVCVAPSNKDVIWVGTGENNPRNSVSYGDGVYKSTDGGKTWTNMGLRKTYQIGKILVHPTNPDVVYVGALGRLYGPSPDRGLYKTTDGGKTWERVLFVDDNTGVIDMRMHPTQPDTLLVATWERKRDGYDSWPGNEPLADGYDGYDPAVKWGAGGAIWRTTDGGKHFERCARGLPSNKLGRIGLDWYRKDPNTVFAIIDCEKIGMGTPPKVASGQPYFGARGDDAGGDTGAVLLEVAENGPADKAGLKAGDVVTRINDKPVTNNPDLLAIVSEKKAGDKVTVKFLRDGKEVDKELTIGERPQGGFGGRGGGVYMGLAGEDAGDDKGAKLKEVVKDGPAEKAGLKAEDVIKKAGDKPIKSYQDLLDYARGARPGDKASLEVQRGDETKKVELEFAQRPGGGGGGFGPGGPSATRPYRSYYGGQRENVQADQGPDSHEYGGIYKSTDAGESWTRINSLNPRPMYFSQVRVDPSDDKYLFVCGVTMHASTDGGKTFRVANSRQGYGVHADQHALWIDPRDGRHMIVGCDGGFYATYDRGNTWDHLNTMAMGQFYHVAVSTKKPYWVFGGLQDNGSWGGPSVGLSGGGPVNEDWVSVGGGDGFVCRVDQSDPDVVYSEMQDGGIRRYNLRTGEVVGIRPPGEGQGQGGQGQRRSQYRFNWNTPFILSNHNPAIFYSAGNVVFRSVKRGEDLKVISPEITKTKHGSATALAESPRNPDVLWVGADDGALWVTRNGGKDWTELSAKVGLPGPRWVATIEPSRFAEGRAYVCFDAHRSDDDEPYVYVTEDYGQTWKSLRANLPVGSSRCLREDVVNKDLLYCGTEFALYASLNRGASWTRINADNTNNRLPTVAVHEVAVHPTAGEIVAATHGRSLWILDVTALRQVSADTLKDKPALYRPNTVTRYTPEPTHGRTNRRYVGENPRPGAHIYYSLPAKAEKATLEVFDVEGKSQNKQTVSAAAGLHRVTWNLTIPAGRQGLRSVPEGAYRVVLTVDGKELTQTLRVEGEGSSFGGRFGEEDEEEEEEIERIID